MKVKWRCWFARYEESVTLGGDGVEVTLSRVAVLGIHNPPSFPPVAHIPIEVIPEEFRVTGTELTLEITAGKPPATHLRREGPKSVLDEAFGL